jgi:hypothetical protein
MAEPLIELEAEIYLSSKLRPAYFALQKEIQGRGCGCRVCAETRVKDFNSYLGIYTCGERPDLEYRVVILNRRGDFEIE